MESAAVKSTHVEPQISPMRLSMWALLTVLVTAENISVQGVALLWLPIIQGVLRPAHLQGPRIVALLPQSLEGRASSAKAEVFGRRRPFSFRCQRVCLLGSGLESRVMCFISLSVNAGRQFFLPDTVAPGAGFHAKSWTTTPVAPSKGSSHNISLMRWAFLLR